MKIPKSLEKLVADKVCAESDSDCIGGTEEIYVNTRCMETARFSALEVLQRAEKLEQALKTIAGETEIHYSSVGKWSKDVANEALSDWQAWKGEK